MSLEKLSLSLVIIIIMYLPDFIERMALVRVLHLYYDFSKDFLKVFVFFKDRLF